MMSPHARRLFPAALVLAVVGCQTVTPTSTPIASQAPGTAAAPAIPLKPKANTFVIRGRMPVYTEASFATQGVGETVDIAGKKAKDMLDRAGHTAKQVPQGLKIRAESLVGRIGAAMSNLLLQSLGPEFTGEQLVAFLDQWWVRLFFPALRGYMESTIPAHFDRPGSNPLDGPRTNFFKLLATQPRFIEVRPDSNGEWQVEVPENSGPVKIQMMLPNGKHFDLEFPSGNKASEWLNGQKAALYDLGQLGFDPKAGIAPQHNPLEDIDSDHDGQSDAQDLDDDNDGSADSVDEMPFDATEAADNDHDGIGDKADDDDDNDGTMDDADTEKAEVPDHDPDELVMDDEAADEADVPDHDEQDTDEAD